MITSTQVCSYAFQCDDDAWDFSFWWFVWKSIATNHEFCIWLSHAVCDLHDCAMWNLHCFFTQNIAEPLFCQTSTVLFSLEQRGKISLAFVCNCVSGSPSSRLATCVKIGKKVIAIEHFFWKTTHHSLWRNLQSHSQEMYPRLVQPFVVSIDSSNGFMLEYYIMSRTWVTREHSDSSLMLWRSVVLDSPLMPLKTSRVFFPPFFQGSSWHMFPLLQRCSYTTWTGSSLIWWSWELPT